MDPQARDRYAIPTEPSGTPDEMMISLHYSPERMIWPQLADYPAHLHINILPQFQGSGHGRALIETFLSAAAAHGALGVHVCMVSSNVRAAGLYQRLGFAELSVPDPGPVTYLGRSTNEQPTREMNRSLDTERAPDPRVARMNTQTVGHIVLGTTDLGTIIETQQAVAVLVKTTASPGPTATVPYRREAGTDDSPKLVAASPLLRS